MPRLRVPKITQHFKIKEGCTKEAVLYSIGYLELNVVNVCKIVQMLLKICQDSEYLK